MSAPAPTGFESIQSRPAILVFDSAFAGLCIYVFCTTVAEGRRGAALALLGAVVAMHLVRIPHALEAGIRWGLALALLAISGGPDSPLLPSLIIVSFSYAAIFGLRAGLIASVLSMVAVWAMTLVMTNPRPGSYLPAAFVTPLVIGAGLMGSWIRQTSGAVLRCACDMRDELLRLHRERLRDLTTIQGELAHALKNPLASIKGLVGLIALEPGRAPERLQALRQDVDRMQAIIEEYLSFSRPLTPLVPEPFDVSVTVRRVAKLHEGIAGARQISLDVSQVDTVVMQGDPQKVKQMLIGLVDNAIEAGNRGTSVELTCRRQGDRIVIAVLDCGPGISEELLPRVMEPGVTTKQNRAGLGLTIVRVLAEQHSGLLRLRNREGGGLAAELDLPVHCSCDGHAQPLA